LLAIIADEQDARLPIDARASLIVLAAQLQALQTMIGSIERRLIVQHRANEASKQLEGVPGIGLIGASAIAATITDPNAFRFAPCCVPTPWRAEPISRFVWAMAAEGLVTQSEAARVDRQLVRHWFGETVRRHVLVRIMELPSVPQPSADRRGRSVTSAKVTFGELSINVVAWISVPNEAYDLNKELTVSSKPGVACFQECERSAAHPRVF
jgi:hypothetical protein